MVVAGCLSALVVTGCGTQQVARLQTRTHTMPSSIDASTPSADAPDAANGRFGQPWVLDDGALRVDPAGSRPPAHSQQDADQAARTAQREFYLDSVGQHSSGQVTDLGSSYGLVTLGSQAKVTNDDPSGAPAPDNVSSAAYQRRPAWVVWFRVTGDIYNCPAQATTTTTRPVLPSVRGHAGWHVFVYPDELDAAFIYLQTRPSPCGEGVMGGTATVAAQHIGVPWRLVSRSSGHATLAYTAPACSRPDMIGSVGSAWAVDIVVTVPFGDPTCPSPAEQTVVVDVPDGAQLQPGVTGVLTGR